MSNLSAFVLTPTASGGKAWTVTVRKNGANTALTCVINNALTSCSDTNVAHAVSFAVNDTLDLQVVGSGNPTATTFGWVANLG